VDKPTQKFRTFYIAGPAAILLLHILASLYRCLARISPPTLASWRKGGDLALPKSPAPPEEDHGKKPGPVWISHHAGPFLSSVSDNLASRQSDNLHPIFNFLRVDCKWIYFM